MNYLNVISHRGNLYGPAPELENTPVYIDKAINELFEVEVDIWFIENNFYLGHDKPDHFIDLSWLKERKEYLILHCKNLAGLYLLKDEYHCFWHQEDNYTLTSKNKIWTYPGQLTGPDVIVVDLEVPTKERIAGYKKSKCSGVCSDYADFICTDFLTTIV